METITECPPEERVKPLKADKDPRRWRRTRCEPYQELGNLLADLEDIARGLANDYGEGAASGPTMLSAELLATQRAAVRLALDVTRRNILAVMACKVCEEQDLEQTREVIVLRVRDVAERGY